MLFLCVLVLLLGGLSSCELIEGAFGSNEKPSATPLENLIGTWKTEGYDERNFVTVNFGTGDVQARVAYVFSSGSIIFDRQVQAPFYNKIYFFSLIYKAALLYRHRELFDHFDIENNTGSQKNQRI